jgi:hypothetical protein
MSRRGPAPLVPLETLFETRRGKILPLSPRLSRLYGSLRMPLPRSRPHVFSNFVTTLDGVVSLNVKGHASGGDISGWKAEDDGEGLLRAIADVVIIGLRHARRRPPAHLTAEPSFPTADDHRRPRALANARPVERGRQRRGMIDLRLPIFASGKVPALTDDERWCEALRANVPKSVQIRAFGRSAGISRAPSPTRPDDASPSESRSRAATLAGDFMRAAHRRAVPDVAPQIAGRDPGDRRLSLVMGRRFAPRNPKWGALTDVRRGARHLFLRYSFRG